MTNRPLFGCQFGAIDPSLIIRSLTTVANMASDDLGRALRVRPIAHASAGAAIVKAITCASKEDLEINIRRSLWLSCDGRMSLNVYFHALGCDEDIGDPIPCAHAADIPELFNHMFVEITYADGTVEYALAIIAVLDLARVWFWVHDNTGAELPGATVTMTSARTGADYVVTTDVHGLAQFDVPQGDYDWLVEAATFDDETGSITVVREVQTVTLQLVLTT